MGGETVLVVDDRQDSIEFLRDYVLIPNSYQVLTARNGEDGIRLAHEAHPDLLIADLLMPRLNGLEMLEKLREQRIDLPVILMTFHGTEETAVRAFRLGARDYIIKPFDVDEMLAAIDRALAEARLRRERDQLMQSLLFTNRQLERRVKELQTLYGIGRSVTSLLDLEQVLNRIVEAAVYITSAEEGSLLLVDKETGDLYMRAAQGLGERYAKGFRVRVKDSIVGRVVKTGMPVMLAGRSQEDRFKFKTDYFVRASLNVPLKVGDLVIGVLVVNNKTNSRPFSPSDQQLLLALADYASVAIENARLYQDLSTSRDELHSWSEELEVKVRERTRELQEAQERLIQTEKLASLGQMAARLAQEINTPTQTVVGYVRVLLNKLKPQGPLLEALKSIEQETLRCRRTALVLLEFSHRAPPAVQPTDLNKVIELALDMVARNLGQAGVEVNRGFDPQMPLVLADEKQLKQVFVNLIRNAYEAMPDGGALNLLTRSVGKEVQAVIADSGVGIKPEDMRHIFEPFFTTKDPTKNAGLGLAISYGIVERHHGTIGIESQPGAGTTVTVHLPAAEEEGTFPPPGNGFTNNRP